jgi:hypothetical protein
MPAVKTNVYWQRSEVGHANSLAQQGL